MPWVPLDIHYFQDAKIEAAAEEVGASALAVFSVLLCMAKGQAARGRVEFTWRSLGNATYLDRDDAVSAVRALVSGGVLSCPEESDRGAVLEFGRDAWDRWHDGFRKQTKREAAKSA